MAKLMSIRDFAERYSLSRSTVYRLEERGEINFLKIGRSTRISTEVAEQWFQSLSEAKG